jgi:RecJ-like exonuclease
LAKEDFLKAVRRAAKRFREIDQGSHIKVVSHLDTDGITACAILGYAMNILNMHYSISIVSHLDERALKEISAESFDVIIFSDIGSSQIELIRQRFKDIPVFILDHHTPGAVKPDQNMVHVNPHNFGLTSPKEISGAGVAYLFSRSLDKRLTCLSHLAVIGAIGDNQEHDGFTGLNNDILKAAEKEGKIRVEKSLRLFGAQTKPLYKILKESLDIYIPGVSGSEAGSIEFLKSINIEPKTKGRWTKLSHLTDSQKERLIKGILQRRDMEEKEKDIIGNVYILPLEKEGTFRDAREFSTVLNACGRLGKASLGIGACLNDKSMKIKAEQKLNSYRKEIISTMQWFEDNKDSRNIIKKEGFMIINVKDRVIPTMIGTLCSILSFSKKLEKDTVIMTLGYLDKDSIKLSLRMSRKAGKKIDLKEIASKIAKAVEGQSGGHRNAAGAIVDRKKEKELLECAQSTLKNIVLEEEID